MLDRFKEHLFSLEPDAAGKKFLLAVSGGLDSVVMAELFRLAGYNFSIAHCNFQLRGNESDGDEKFANELAEKWKVPFFTIRFETENFCTQNKVSVQMGARQLRYGWLEEIRQKNKLDYIVTAHHADDAIETFFINLLRGTGISGLHGIKARNENTIRPLLTFYRKELEAFAAKNKLTWREDSSNETDKYERNKIRHHLLPALEEINPKAKDSVSATIKNLGRTELILNDSLEKVAGKYIRVEGDRMYINYVFFKELKPSAGYLYEVIKKMGFNYEQCLQIVEHSGGQPGKIFLSDNHRIVIDRENIIIESIADSSENNTFEVNESLEELSAGMHSYHFKVEARTIDFKIPTTSSEKIALDFDKLTFPFTNTKVGKR